MAVKPNRFVNRGAVMNSDDQVKHRRAIEALRSGVPNRDAVLALGCTQPEIEKMFRQRLQDAKQGLVDGSKTYGMLVESTEPPPPPPPPPPGAFPVDGSKTHGMLVAGDFGTGK